ncbi:E3 SUMO-protein ligase KIAA1586-like [Centruroides vittatus]|uniref:E3 SUMO-protein ligase KIAA1586-like n=1 Tax=Centruroides vittatus TaxID=120091 RepID=UPI00350F0562
MAAEHVSMKRQRVLDDFITKSKKANIDNEEQLQTTISSENCNKEQPETSSEDKQKPTSIENNSSNRLLHCWNASQQEYFLKKYEWLHIASNENVGCQWCSQVGSLNVESAKHSHVSLEWKSYSVKPHGTKKEILQASIRKKLKQHHESASHKKAGEIIKTGEKNVISKNIDVANEKFLKSTIHIFNTAYFIIKNNKPFTDFPNLIILQNENNVDLGITSHSRFMVPLIAKHISTEIRRNIFGKLITARSKISIIIDEASTVSHKSVLIIYLKSEVMDFEDSITIFIDLIELEETTSENIFKTLMTVLEKHGFDEQYLKENLIGFCSDGASVMLGKKSGVATRIEQKFPGICIWHCLAHRIQLSLDDVIKDIKARELNAVAKELGTEVLKIGRIFRPRWAACSARTVKAVWKSYQALYSHFNNNPEARLVSYFKNENFLKDLALMNDILEEIALLSTVLQERNVSLIKADRLIRRTITVLINLKNNKGTHEIEAENIVSTKKYNIPFEVSRKKTSIVFSREKLFDSLVKHMTTRLLFDNKNEKYNDLLNSFNVLNHETWPNDVCEAPRIEGENRLKQLNKIIKYVVPVNDFRDFVDDRDIKQKNISITILRARRILNVIAVNSTETERGFSTMNGIMDVKRNSLLIHTTSHLMTINLMGRSLEDFDATPHVKSWLRQGHHSASDKSVKAKVPNTTCKNQSMIWKIIGLEL